MDLQRTLLWVVFCLSLAMLWDRWQIAHGHNPTFLPSQVAQGPAGAANAGRPAAPGAPASAPGAAAGTAPGNALPPTTATEAPRISEKVTVETDVLKLDFDAQGAVLWRAELTQQRGPTPWKQMGLAGIVYSLLYPNSHPQAQQTIVLFDRSATRNYVARSGLLGAKDLPDHNMTFELLPGPRALEAGSEELRVRFVAQSGGLELRKTYVLHRGRYDIGVEHEIRNIGTGEISPTLYLEIARDGDTKGADDSSFYSTYTGPAYYTPGDHFQKVSFEDIHKAVAEAQHNPPALQLPATGKVIEPSTDGWIAMLQHYFVAAWVPPAGAPRQFYTRQVDEKDYSVGATLALGAIGPGVSVKRDAVLYAGPQDQHTLEGIATGLDRVVDYGRLEPICKPLFWLLGWLYRAVANWGWAIVLLTILIKVTFYPLAAAGFRSMARMKEVAPQLQRLKEQYGEDKQRLQQAMMELYRKEKINPVGGCLPMLVQIPVFIALYWVLLGSVELRNAPWIFWIHDLATPDPWFVLPALMMATSWIQYKLNPTPPDPVQAKMMAVMPFVFGVMFFFFPSGLVLYYVLNNMLSIAQQWRINKVIGAPKKA